MGQQYTVVRGAAGWLAGLRSNSRERVIERVKRRVAVVIG